VVNIDQRAHFQGVKITLSEAGVRQRVVHPPDTGVPHMFGSHALATGPPLSVIEHPRCQDCQTRTTLRRIAPGPAGYEFRTFACPKCDGVQRTLVVSDPMSGDARGWLRGELKSPN
jgi:hypothetical protein